MENRTRGHCTSGNLYNHYSFQIEKKTDGMEWCQWHFSKKGSNADLQSSQAWWGCSGFRTAHHDSRMAKSQLGWKMVGRCKIMINDSITEWKLDAGNSTFALRERRGYKIWGHLFAQCCSPLVLLSWKTASNNCLFSSKVQWLRHQFFPSVPPGEKNLFCFYSMYLDRDELQLDRAVGTLSTIFVS